MFGQECPIQSWLVVDPSSGGVHAALGRIPHIVELYQPGPGAPWLMRPANPPDLQFSQLREVDDAYKIRLQQIAAGQIPIEDLADSSGITGMLFGLDRVSACANILQGVVKVVSEKARNNTNIGIDLFTLEAEFQELFKIPLDVYHLLSEKSLLSFLLKFKPLFNLYNDGMSWKILLAEGWDQVDMDQLVRTTILVQPKQRRVVRLAGLIPLPVTELDDKDGEVDVKPAATGGADSIAALVSMLQGFQKPPAAPATMLAAGGSPAEASASTVTAQIQQLLQKKKQQTETAPAAPASGTALNELMAALQAAKNK